MSKCKCLRGIDRLFAPMDAQEAVPHPLKGLSRRFLGAGAGLAILIHALGIGGALLYGLLTAESVVPVRLMPYPSRLIDVIDPATLLTSEQGGGGGGGRLAGGAPPPEAGDDIRSKGKVVPVAVKIGIPEPIPDAELAEEVTLATQEEMKREIMVAEEETEPTEKPGMEGGGGGGTGEGGIGGGIGSGGGQGQGPPGTWRYDTPPNPRRLITAVQPKKLRKVEGTVRFRLLIDEFGRVIDANIVESSGYAELDALALSAINHSTFNPATLRGRTVKAWITFGYGFRVRRL